MSTAASQPIMKVPAGTSTMSPGVALLVQANPLVPAVFAPLPLEPALPLAGSIVPAVPPLAFELEFAFELSDEPHPATTRASEQRLPIVTKLRIFIWLPPTQGVCHA